MPVKHSLPASLLVHQPRVLQSHLGHTLKFNLCGDDDDIVLLKTHDLVKKALHLLVSFIGVGSGVLTRAPVPLLLSVPICSMVLWFELLRSLLISYCDESGNYLLAVTLYTIVHDTAGLPSLFNVVHSSLSASFCLSLFHQSSLCSFTFNVLYDHCYHKFLEFCNPQYAVCADIICSIGLSGHSSFDFWSYY